MKICILFPQIYQVFAGAQKIGGAELNVYYLANELSREGKCLIEILVGDYGQANIVKYNNVELKKIAYFNIEKYTSIPYKIIRRLNIIRLVLSSDSVVFMTTLAGEFISYLVVFAKFFKRKKVFFRIGSDQDVNMHLLNIKEKYIYYCYKLFFRYVDILICQKIDQQRLLDKKMMKRSVVIPNGIPIPERKIDSKLKKSILWVSRFDCMKRPELFIELAQKLPNEKFVMIMPVAGNRKEPIINEINKIRNIEYYKFVKIDEIQEFYDRAKCFVNTSTYEGFPNSFIQAGIGYTPILSFNVNPDNIFNIHKIGFHCNDSIEHAIQFIKHLNFNSIKIMGNNAYAYCKQNHSIENTARCYSALFDSLYR